MMLLTQNHHDETRFGTKLGQIIHINEIKTNKKVTETKQMPIFLCIFASGFPPNGFSSLPQTLP